MKSRIKPKNTLPLRQRVAFSYFAQSDLPVTLWQKHFRCRRDLRRVPVTARYAKPPAATDKVRRRASSDLIENMEQCPGTHGAMTVYL
jgi:hypothetical protein